MPARRSAATERRTVLEQARDEILKRVPFAEDTALSGLVRELRQVLAELDGLPSKDAKTPTDEIAKRREERRRKARAGRAKAG